MEQHGRSNAGLLDQRAILRFVRDYIKAIKGNASAVSVRGESAGASTIMHHLSCRRTSKRRSFRKLFCSVLLTNGLGPVKAILTRLSRSLRRLLRRMQKVQGRYSLPSDTQHLRKKPTRTSSRGKHVIPYRAVCGWRARHNSGTQWLQSRKGYSIVFTRLLCCDANNF